MKIPALKLVSLSAFLMCSCTFNAQLTPTSGPLVRQGITALPAKFVWAGTGSGKVTVTMPDGEICSGRYFTVAEGYSSASYGQSSGSFYGQGYGSFNGSYGGLPLYGQGYESMSGYSNSNSMSLSNTSRNEQYGRAVATGTKGTVITMNYVTSRSSPTHGHGTGHDNKGNLYTIVY